VTPRDFGHIPIIGPRVVRNVPRVPDALLERLRRAYMPDVSDAVGEFYTLDPAIRPLYAPMRRLVGRALTVKAPQADNLTIHGALSLVQPGDVLVVDWRGYSGGCGTGAGSLVLPIRRGLAGVVVDGGWRDAGELQGMDLPIFGRAISAFSPPKRRPGEINVPVCCGGVVVQPGDIVVADPEGIAIVPRAWAERVADSLRSYAPHTLLESWDFAALERTSAERAKYYDALMKEYGGTYEDWKG